MKINTMNRFISLSGNSGLKGGPLALAMLMFFQSTLFAYPFGNKKSWEAPLVTPSVTSAYPTENGELSAAIEQTQQAKGRMIPGGPDQPEVASFSPIGVSDMVDPFTGDFSYNLPLLDVDGYPINLSYSGGVTMDQEASWVGLGWNLNPGVMNRSMRGIPDDFNGSDKIVKDMNLKRNWTLGLTTALDIELFGFGPENETNSSGDTVQSSFSLSASLGITYNNYNGFNSTFSIGPSMSFVMGKSNDGSLSPSLGFSGSSQGGATISPSIGLSSTKLNQNAESVTKGINIGSSFNSRGGLSNLSISYSRTTSKMEKTNKTLKNGQEQMRMNKSSLPISSTFNFGMSTYTPVIAMPMSTGGGTFSFKLGPDAVGFDGHLQFTGAYTAQWLKDKKVTQSAYGYQNLHSGQFNKNAMMDFNRENDGSFTKNTPALPVTALTYDIYSASGHGVGGSYRMVRNDIGYVFDAEVNQNSVNGSLGLEVGAGATFKGGIDLAASYSNSHSESWNAATNGAAKGIRFKPGKLMFREANEKAVAVDPSHFNKIGGSDPVRFKVTSFTSTANQFVNQNGTNIPSYSSYDKVGEDKRNQPVYTLTNSELNAGLGIQDLPSAAYAKNSNVQHHIGQFTVLNTEGSRYVYGIPAYSITQKTVSFAVGATNQGGGITDTDCDGLVSHSESDASPSNTFGVDNYYNAVTTPPYAHSYLLTTVLNADYVDADNIKGPSKGDLGGYITFDYEQIPNYKWRNPVNEQKSNYDEGLNADILDDKAHYVYGEKELWYVKEIRTKNHIAIFYTSKRQDGYGVYDEHGGLNSSGTAQKQLDSIALFSLPDYEANQANATPLKVVHFLYDYSLCPGYHGNLNQTEGKLTLLKVWFTYQNSNKGNKTPYVFEYDNNFPYDMQSVDRWNGYKPKSGSCVDLITDPLQPSDFPYVGFDKTNSDIWASAWNLTDIYLPSGGKIEVFYESDDYGYVQHKRANQMFKIVGIQAPGANPNYTTGVESIASDQLKNARLYFELIDGFNNINDYVQKDQLIYFRALMDFDDKYDFVPGYAKVASCGVTNLGADQVGYVDFYPDKLRDNGPSEFNPIAVAAIQFARNNLSKFIPPSSTNAVDENSNLPGLIESLGGAFSSLQELFIGPNQPLYNKKIGTKLSINHSWLRLQNPNKAKLGGGHRVKEIRMYDNFDQMTGGEMTGYHYGQVYSYTNEDGTSSGVAAYEPTLGGDENPWRQPLANNISHLLAPDTRNYQETPFGEQFFPSPTVGYARVTVRDIPRPGVGRTATGRVVNEFYTARDFPTIVNRTPVDYKRFKLPVFAIFFSMMIDEMTASQGFVVETNDMHGKAKSTKVYAENQNNPISKVEYVYLQEPKNFDGVAASHLVNTVTTINKNGTVGSSTIGLNYEGVADFRKSATNSINGSIGINLNFTLPFVVVPTVSGSGGFERTAFRSATFTKVIERFGILQKTIATDLGSVVETADLAYDAETGATLLTQTTTDFNDKVYNFTYPAHWYYDGMGQAYRNAGYAHLGSATFVNGSTSSWAAANFAEGDELDIILGGNHTRAWVTGTTTNSVSIQLKDGTPVAGTVTFVKVLRSGRRNMQTTPIGTIALRSNPLVGLTGNVFDQVLQAGAVEFSEEWNTFCECFVEEGAENYTVNPYVLGVLGTWRPKASYLHLAGRTQSFSNQNSYIRDDGMFTSFTPFYKLNSGAWNIDRQNWTYTSSVVDFSPFGQTLETVDALNRYSASMFGYNQTLPVAVAANTRYRQLGFDGFEDYDYGNCSDDHFRFGTNATLVNTEAHTGRHSVKVSSGSPVVFTNVLVDDCEVDSLNITCPPLLIQYTPGSKGIPGGVAIGPFGQEYGGYTITYTQNSTTDPIPNEYIIVGNGNSSVFHYQFTQQLQGYFEPWFNSTLHVVVTFDNGCVLEADI